MTNSITDDLAWMWTFVEDTVSLSRNRRLAEEVKLLSARISNRQRRGIVPDRSSALSQTLGCARQSLLMVLDCAEAPTEFHIEWGNDGSSQSKAGGDSGTENSAPPLEEPQSLDLTAREIGAGDPQTSHAGAVDLAAATAAIDLCDWLERAREDERIPSKRAIEVALQKSFTLLGSLSLARIEGMGKFDQNVQQIVDSVAAVDKESDMVVFQTVECGYRAGEKLLRPQKVIVYRFTAPTKAAG
jgi:hypothetical protein